MILTIIIAAATLILGGVGGYLFFKYVLKGKYNEMMATVEKEAEVIKEKKLLEVKEKFLNKKSELEKEVQVRNQHIQQSENRLKQRELSLNQRQEELGRRKNDLDNIVSTYPEDEKMKVLKGRFGIYISYNKHNYKIPRSYDATKLSYKDCCDIVADPANASKKRGSKK